MNVVVWADGEIRRPSEPILSGLHHGFTVGDGVFETLAVRDNIPFALSRHLTRLQYSADRMALGKMDFAMLRNGIAEVIAVGQGEVGRLRITVATGAGPLGAHRVSGALTVVIAGGPALRARTCSVVRSPWKRNERSPLTGVKSISYGENVVTLAYAEERGADEAIMSNTQGHLCEGSSTNVFIEKDGEVITPPLASGCLPGIARGLVLEWGARSGVPVRVGAPGELSMHVLDDVARGDASCAVTSVTRGVQQVTTLDGSAIAPGKLLARLQETYETFSAVEVDPALPRQTSR